MFPPPGTVFLSPRGSYQHTNSYVGHFCIISLNWGFISGRFSQLLVHMPFPVRKQTAISGPAAKNLERSSFQLRAKFLFLPRNSFHKMGKGISKIQWHSKYPPLWLKVYWTYVMSESEAVKRRPFFLWLQMKWKWSILWSKDNYKSNSYRRPRLKLCMRPYWY